MDLLAVRAMKNRRLKSSFTVKWLRLVIGQRIKKQLTARKNNGRRKKEL